MKKPRLLITPRKMTQQIPNAPAALLPQRIIVRCPPRFLGSHRFSLSGGGGHLSTPETQRNLAVLATANDHILAAGHLTRGPNRIYSHNCY